MISPSSLPQQKIGACRDASELELLVGKKISPTRLCSANRLAVDEPTAGHFLLIKDRQKMSTLSASPVCHREHHDGLPSLNCKDKHATAICNVLTIHTLQLHYLDLL